MVGALARWWGARREVDARLWLLVYGQLVLSIGRGVLLPFATLYFYNERGFPLAFIGLTFAVALPLGALVGLAWGTLSDRFGRKPLMILGFVGHVATTTGLAFVETPAQYFGIVLLNAISVSAWNPSARAMVADVTPPDRRTRAYGLLYLANNAGISVGLVLGGALALVLPYATLFFVEAAGALGYLVVVMLFVAESHHARVASPARGPLATVAGHLASVSVPLRDRRFLLFATCGVLAGFGWSQFYVTYSPYMKNVVGASDAGIGALFAVNTVMVVALQVPVAAWAERRRRTRVYILATYLLAWSLLLTWAAGRVELVAARLAVMAVAIAIMTLGEIAVVPVGSALVAALAGGQQHHGKYMAAFDLVWTLATGVGGVLGGAFFDAGEPYLLWPAMTALVALSLLGYWRLGRTLPAEVERPVASG